MPGPATAPGHGSLKTNRRRWPTSRFWWSLPSRPKLRAWRQAQGFPQQAVRPARGQTRIAQHGWKWRRLTESRGLTASAGAKVQERTDRLPRKRGRYRRLTSASDGTGSRTRQATFTKVYGPVSRCRHAGRLPGWRRGARKVAGGNEAERTCMPGDQRRPGKPFLDFIFSRVTDGSPQKYRVSGEPMFNRLRASSAIARMGVEWQQ